MKTGRFFALMLIVLLLSVATVGAYEMHYRESVQLPANKNEVSTNSYAGNYGKGSLSVLSGSAGNAKLLLKSSTGSGWTTLTSISVAPGGYDSTNVWGRDDTDYLFKIVVQSDPKVLGNPGRIAYGYLYTGFDN